MTRHRSSGLGAHAGFTLIELLVVILVLGVLLAVALPSFLGQQAKAQDSAVKQYLTIAWKTEEAEAVGEQALNAAQITAAINSSEPELDAFTDSDADCADVDNPAYSDNRQICVADTSTATTAFFFAKSDSGTLFCLTEAPTNTPAVERISAPSDVCDGGFGAGDDNYGGAEEAPENTVAPSLTGPPQQNETLTADPGQWTGVPELSYQWQYDDGSWLDIPGASSQTYTPGVLVVGKPVRVQVTATEDAFATPAYSNPTVPIYAAPTAPPARPLTLTLLNGVGENSVWISPANMGNLIFRVGLPSSSLPGDVVHVRALYLTNSVAVTTAGVGGGGNVTVSINVSTFPDAPISFEAWVTNAQGASSTRNAAHNKDTVAPGFVAIPIVPGYTDNVGSTPDTVGVSSGANGAGWMNTVHFVQISPGSGAYSQYISDYWGSGTVTLAPATSSVTYEYWQTDRAGNASVVLTTTFPATQ